MKQNKRVQFVAENRASIMSRIYSENAQVRDEAEYLISCLLCLVVKNISHSRYLTDLVANMLPDDYNYHKKVSLKLKSIKWALSSWFSDPKLTSIGVYIFGERRASMSVICNTRGYCFTGWTWKVRIQKDFVQEMVFIAVLYSSRIAWIA